MIGEKRKAELLELRLEVKELKAKIRALEAAAARNPAQLSADGDWLEILGIRYAIPLFRQFAFAPPGTVLEIMGRQVGGSVTVRSITTELDAMRVLKQVRAAEAARLQQFMKGPT